MQDINQNTVLEIRGLILDAIGHAVAEGTLPAEPIPDFTIEVPGDRTHGDYAANVAMVSARAFHKAPRQIAEAILPHLVTEGTVIDRAEIAGPGFINFYIGDTWYDTAVDTVLTEGENYGRSDYGKGKKALVEFVSANPTGPMHIGNARGGALGDGLAAVMDAAGFTVAREFYINDAGNQINKFGHSLSVRYQQLCGSDMEIPEDCYLGEDIVAHARNFKEIHGDVYMTASEEDRRAALVAYALPLNIQGLERDLLKYRIRYDRWFKESTLHENGEVSRIIEKLKETGYTYEQEDALWFKATAFDCDKDFVLVRSNGIPTYIVPDIAYHYNKLVTREFDLAVNVLGADHHGYVPRLKAAMAALGVDPERIYVVLMQMVRLVRDGKEYKLSKRSGKAISLATLLDEIDIDAARMFFNLREPSTHFEFDLDLALEQSSQNPVYYVQYAHARICSILRNLTEDGVDVDAMTTLSGKYTEEAERELIRFLTGYTGEIATAARTYNPARMTKYAMELATYFHKFYNTCRVKGDDKAVMAARVKLCLAAKQTLYNCLTLLKITAPEKM